MPRRDASGDESLVPARRVAVVVGSLPIEDGQTPPPTVGDVAWFTLTFVEAGHHEPDATVSTIRARAESIGDGSPREPGMRWDGTPHDRPPTWPTVLHGDGWSATWAAPRPVIGQVRLRGTLSDDLAIGVRTGVRGRVIRIRVVTDTIDRADPDRTHWRPIPREQCLRDVDTAPRWFGDGLVIPDDAPATGWFSPVPGDPYVVERGVLVDLDLDDVPELPLRPAVVPAAIAAHGQDLWVADDRLPLVVRVRRPLDERPEAVGCSWPGRILDRERTAGRSLHADRDGCWITGPDGVHRADRDGTVRRISAQPVGIAAADQDLLLTRPEIEPGVPAGLRLTARDGEVTDIDPENRWFDDRWVHAAAADATGRGFVLLLGHRTPPADPDSSGRPDRRPWIGRLSPHGDVVEGPYLDLGQPALAELLGSGPPVVADRYGSGVRRVRDDLTLDVGDRRWGRTLRAYGCGGRVWVATHPPDPRGVDRHGDDAYWPLDGPPRYPEPRQYWLLTEIDPATFDPVTSALVQHVPDALAVDGTGTVWVHADGLRRLPPGNGAAAEPVDIAQLIDHDAGPTDRTGVHR